MIACLITDRSAITASLYQNSIWGTGGMNSTNFCPCFRPPTCMIVLK